MNRLTRTARSFALAAAIACGWMSHAQNPPSSSRDASETTRTFTLDQALAGTVKYEFGQSRAPQIALEKYVVTVSAAEKPALAARLAAALDGATNDGKRFLCRMLMYIGGDAQVPALARLLGDQELEGHARYALERIPGPAADAAFRDALGSLKGRALLGAIGSIGERRDAKAVDALVKFLNSSDEAVVAAAASSLGKIGTPDAARAIAAARSKASPAVQPALTDAYLVAAERLLASGNADAADAIYQQLHAGSEPRLTRLAALKGLLATRGDKAVPALVDALKSNDAQTQTMAAGFIADLPAVASIEPIAAVLPQLVPSAQVAAIESLAGKGGSAARSAITAAAKSADDQVRIAALKALGKAGDASSIAILLEAASTRTGAEQTAARDSLATVPGNEVNDALVKSLDGSDSKAKVEIVRALGARNAAAAMPAILKSAADADAAVRVESHKALAIVAGEKDLPAMLALLPAVKSDAEREAAEEALVAAARRATDGAGSILAAVPNADVATKGSLFRVAGRLGGAKALDALRAAAKDANEDVKDAAIRALADVADPAVAPDLLQLATGADKPAHRVLAMRGYVRLASSESLPAGQRLAMLKAALPATFRADEKKLVLGAAAGINSADALAFVVPFMDDPAVAEEAAGAAVSIARSLAGKSAREVAAAMNKVVSVSKNNRTLRDAQDILAKMK